MKFNHLLPRHLAEGTCKNLSKVHRWKPVRINAMQGNYMSISFICKRCKERAGNFITVEQYQLHAEKLERESEI